MYKPSDILTGMILECTNDGGFSFWTQGKTYPVFLHNGKPVISDDVNSKRGLKYIVDRLNGKTGDMGWKVDFEIVEEKGENDMYKKGMTVVRNDTEKYSFWTVGKEYEIQADDEGDLFIQADDQSQYFINAWGEPWVEENFDIKKDENVTDLKAGMTLISHVAQYAMEGSFFTDGQEYPVFEALNGDLAIRSDLGTPWFSHELAQLARAGFTFTEKRSVEKKVVAGMILRRINDKFAWLTQGKLYEVHQTESGTPYVIDEENDRYMFYNTEFLPSPNWEEVTVEEVPQEPVGDTPAFKYDLHIQTNDVREFGRTLDKFLKLVLEEQNAELNLEWAESALQRALEDAK